MKDNAAHQDTRTSTVGPKGDRGSADAGLVAHNGDNGVGPEDIDERLGRDLGPEHLRMLRGGSGISPEVVAARGYRTVETKSELRRLGFADSQCNPPGLLIPVHSPAGEVVNYQFRPDRPRIRDGKPAKYETPRGSRMTLDVHPFARGILGDTSTPL